MWQNTVNLLARVTIAEVVDEQRLLDIIRKAPVVQNDPKLALPDMGCSRIFQAGRGWRGGLSALQSPAGPKPRSHATMSKGRLERGGTPHASGSDMGHAQREGGRAMKAVVTGCNRMPSTDTENVDWACRHAHNSCQLKSPHPSWRVSSIFSSAGQGFEELRDHALPFVPKSASVLHQGILSIVRIPTRELPVDDTDDTVPADKNIGRVQIRVREHGRRPRPTLHHDHIFELLPRLLVSNLRMILQAKILPKPEMKLLDRFEGPESGPGAGMRASVNEPPAQLCTPVPGGG